MSLSFQNLQNDENTVDESNEFNLQPTKSQNCDVDNAGVKFPLKIPSMNLNKSHNIMGIKFAPINLPLERRLQTFAVMQWWISILLLPVLSVLICLYMLLFTRFWVVPVLYVSWIVIYDYKTPKSGGRRLEFMRRLRIWKYYRDYFPISLQKTADLDANENYIIGYHPHGIISCGAFCNFGTEATGFSKLFPGIKCFLMTLNSQFYWPFLRGYILACGKQREFYFSI